MFKVIVGVCLLFSNGNLAAEDNGSEQPNRAGTVGQHLVHIVNALEASEKEINRTGWAPPKEQYVVVRAGTVPQPSHRPDKDPHEGHTVKSLPNPYSGKKH